MSSSSSREIPWLDSMSWLEAMQNPLPIQSTTMPQEPVSHTPSIRDPDSEGATATSRRDHDHAIKSQFSSSARRPERQTTVVPARRPAPARHREGTAAPEAEHSGIDTQPVDVTAPRRVTPIVGCRRPTPIVAEAALLGELEVRNGLSSPVAATPSEARPI